MTSSGKARYNCHHFGRGLDGSIVNFQLDIKYSGAECEDPKDGCEKYPRLYSRRDSEHIRDKSSRAEQQRREDSEPLPDETPGK
jgi:hypothetical protein